MSIFEKILDFLTANPFETEEEAENRMLYEDLNRQVRRYQRYNKRYLIEKRIKPFLQEQFFIQNEILPTEQQLERMAENAFIQGKDLGYIDILNNRVNEVTD